MTPPFDVYYTMTLTYVLTHSLTHVLTLYTYRCAETGQMKKMSISLNGFNEKCVTFYAEDAVETGTVAAMTDNMTVGESSDGGSFIGVAVNAKDGYACVQIAGYMSLSYSGDTVPALGCCNLVSDGSGGVKVSADGRRCLVVDVDTDNGTVGIIL